MSMRQITKPVFDYFIFLLSLGTDEYVVILWPTHFSFGSVTASSFGNKKKTMHEVAVHVGDLGALLKKQCCKFSQELAYELRYELQAFFFFAVSQKRYP